MYEPKKSGHVKDNLYHMMIGNSLNDEWEINRKKLSDAGFELVLDAVRGASVIPCAAIFHHYPSGSTVLLEDSRPDPIAKVFGNGRETARDALIELVRPYNFELKEVSA